MPESSTPLSDWISRCVEQNTVENYEQFLRVFLGSQLGVIVIGAPAGTTGQYVAGKNELGVGLSVTPDGKKTVLACADLAVYVQRFRQPFKQFNAEVSAATLLNIAWSNPDCEGITVNSAASENRIVIPRKDIAKLMDNRSLGFDLSYCIMKGYRRLRRYLTRSES